MSMINQGWNSMHHRRISQLATAILISLIAASCGGGGGRAAPVYTIGGSVSGLTAGAQVTLTDNGTDSIAVDSNAPFTFATSVPQLSSYLVTVTASPVSQNCVVVNGSGSKVEANVSNIIVTCTTKAFEVGGSVAGLTGGGNVVLSDNGADLLTVSASGSFTFAKAVTYGSPYSVAVVTPPAGQTCSIDNSTSASVTGNVSTVSVTCTALPQYAYIVDSFTQSILQYSVSATGDWTPLPIPAVTPFPVPQSVVIDSTGHYAYVADYAENTVAQYTVGATGELAPMAVFQVDAGGGPLAVSLDPLGRYAYAIDFSFFTISQFSIDGGGSLIPLSPAQVPSGTDPSSMAIDSQGKNAYALNQADATVSQYAIGPDGALTALNPATVPMPYQGLTLGSITLDPAGANLYVMEAFAGTVAQFTRGMDGQLTQTPTTVSAGAPLYMVIHPTGLYAYVISSTGSGAGSIYQFSIAADGTLSPMATPSLPVGIRPVAMTLDRTGTYVFVPNTDGSVSRFAIGQGGALTPLTTLNLTPGTAPLAIAIAN